MHFPIRLVQIFLKYNSLIKFIDYVNLIYILTFSNLFTSKVFCQISFYIKAVLTFLFLRNKMLQVQQHFLIPFISVPL